MVTKKSPFWEAFNSRDDLRQYGVDALLLFALQLKFGIEDIDLVASNCLTEGGEDKKADLIYIDSEAGCVVIAQTSIAQNIIGKDGKLKKAKANKASDLNTTIPWLLSQSIDKVPENLKTHAQELRRAISEGEIKDIHIWFVHNLLESDNVRTELEVVEQNTASTIKSHFSHDIRINIQAIEVGRNTLEGWYKGIQSPILVKDKFNIPISDGFEIEEKDWKSFVTAIPVAFLYGLYKKYGTDILSADIRDYLGSRKSDDNINNGIKQTAKNDSGHFWVYNNGITVLVNKFTPLPKGKPQKIKINGFSIINGAQTAGSVGSLSKPPEGNALVPVRFIICVNQETLRNIVKYNNTQNKMLGWDSRSNHSVQTRLINEFDKYFKISYSPRRGGREDAIRRGSDNIPSVIAGQALAAFHGDPHVAYHEKTTMWVDDEKYIHYFNDSTNAKNIFFALSLLKAVGDKKMFLWNKSNANNLIGQENEQFVFFRKRGSIIMMTSAIASCLEDILNIQIPNKFAPCFKKNLSLEAAIKMWHPIVNIASAFTEPLSNGLADGFKAHEKVKKAIGDFRSLIKATIVGSPKVFSDFQKHVN